MKIKLLFFLLLFSLCSSEVVDEGIFIDPVDLKNLKMLETNENIDLSNNDFLIINYWASWCLECIEEHPYLIELSKTKGFENSVFMLSFQDSKENALKFVNEYGAVSYTHLTLPTKA